MPRPRILLVLFILLTMVLNAAATPAQIREGNSEPGLKESGFEPAEAVNYREVMKFLGITLSRKQEGFLARHRFLLLPAKDTELLAGFDPNSESSYANDEMLYAFDRIGGSYDVHFRGPENAKLVTPDIVLHAFHTFFVKAVSHIEKTTLLERLVTFLSLAREGALKNRDRFQGELSQHWETLAAQFTVPLVLALNRADGEKVESRYADLFEDSLATAKSLYDAKFGKDFDQETGQKILKELELIFKAEARNPSPLFAEYRPGVTLTNYTLYTPRGHYEKDSSSRAYFRAMTYLGLNSYYLSWEPGVTDAVLVARLFETTPGLFEAWREIMDITSFFFGEPDDLTIVEWTGFLKDRFDGRELTHADLPGTQAFEIVKEHLARLRPPAIYSENFIDSKILEKEKKDLAEESKALRIFGHRFNFDGWIFSRLTKGEEKTDVHLPSLPSALFVPAVFGSDYAKRQIGTFLEQNNVGFNEPEARDAFLGKLDEVAGDLGQVEPGVWFSSLSTAWLHVLSFMKKAHGPGYPLYMRDELFPVKQLQTFLGSYAELKHDAILYAKQAVTAEMGAGEGEEIPPVPKALVEPNLEFWQAFKTLVDVTHDLFLKEKLWEEATLEFGRLSLFKETVHLYASVAGKQHAGEPLSEEEYEKLRTTGLEYMAAPIVMGTALPREDRLSGIISDVFTDNIQAKVLYEATGSPYVMLALVGNEDTPRLTIGLAFNHYELTGPSSGQRYTDKNWQFKAYDFPESLPEKNFWYADLNPEGPQRGLSGLTFWAPLIDRLSGDGFDRKQLERLFSRPELRLDPQPLFYNLYGAFADRFKDGGEKAPPRKQAPLFSSVLTEKRMEETQAFHRTHQALLAEVETRYQVPGKVLVAILAISSRVGQFLGDGNSLVTLASLAMYEDFSLVEELFQLSGDDERLQDKEIWLREQSRAKAEWAYGELKALLEYGQSHSKDLATRPGFMFGAFGICQFLPSQVLQFGVDGNQDGTVDLFQPEDALCSLANYMKQKGFKPANTKEALKKEIQKVFPDDRFVNTVMAVRERLK